MDHHFDVIDKIILNIVPIAVYMCHMITYDRLGDVIIIPVDIKLVH